MDQRQPTREMLQKMTDVIVHRGPDDSGFWSEGSVGFGFRRLSIIDLREGRQPLANEDDSVWIVFNGEIYNYKALRTGLESRGHRFKTDTDTEVVVHLYEEYGEDCVLHLRGMFGFAIWDRKRRRLFAARDYFGIKPFYYVHDGKQFVFASEIKSILQSGAVEGRLRVESLFDYLTFQYTPEPETMFVGIEKLPPAHRMTLDADGTFRISRYWEPRFEPVERPLEDVAEELRETLKQSVRLHMQSDVRRGCFLSSGIDSTAIATIMRSFEPIKTFSVGFEGDQNETEIARETAKAIGTEHYAKEIGKDEYFACLRQAVWNQEEPVADPSAIALYHVAALAREHVTVVLSGEGADELFGGYRIYREPLALQPIAGLPPLVRSIIQQVARLMPGGIKGRNYLLRATTPLERRFLGNARIFSEEMKAELFARGSLSDLERPDPFRIANRFYEQTVGQDPVTRMQDIDLRLWLPGDILAKADKMTMAHSLELRVPFLDKELFEVARQIPVSQRIANQTTKYVFRKAMEGVIPDFILNRPKLGFPVPLRKWMKEQEGDRIREQIVSGKAGSYFDLSYIDALLHDHRSGRADYSRHLWTLYVFTLWHEQFMEGKSNGLVSDGPIQVRGAGST